MTCSCGCELMDEEEAVIWHQAMDRARAKAAARSDFSLAHDPITGEGLKPLSEAVRRVLPQLKMVVRDDG